MPLTTTRESLATPDQGTVQSRREVALATVAERIPREVSKEVSEQTRRGAVEAAVVEATAPAVKAVVEAKAQASTKGYTPAKQVVATRKLTDELNSVAQEAAATADPAAHIQEMVPRALAGQVDKGTAKEIADTMAKAVGEWKTYASKGGVYRGGKPVGAGALTWYTPDKAAAKEYASLDIGGKITKASVEGKKLAGPDEVRAVAKSIGSVPSVIVI